MSSFLQQTARSIVKTMDWKQLNRTTFVLPSHRAGLVLKNELLRLQKEQKAQAVWAPSVQTLTQLQDALSPLYAEDEFFTIVRLYRKYSAVSRQASEEPMSLDLFYGWGRQMLADFTNIDASMPAEQVPNFFENTIASHELEEWQLDKETEKRLKSLLNGEWVSESEEGKHPSVKSRYEELWRNLYVLYQGLREEMLAEQKGYAGMRQRAVIEQWDDEYIQRQISGRTYVFIGFNYLLPVERELMIRLRDAKQAMFYWDYVPDFQTNEKAFSFAQENARILGDNGERLTMIGERKPITVVSCVSREAQAQYVHRWLQENYTEEGQKVGVVICDETMLESVIYALPAIYVKGKTEPQPINITKGFPLRNTAIYARVLAWLNDPIRGKSTDIVSPDFIDQLSAYLFPVKEEAQEETITNNQSPITNLKWQELLILESEYQVRKIANQMRLLLTEGIGEIPFTLKLMRLLMRRTMESVTMPFHGEPVTDIQIMGVLETRLMDFDKLLLLNVEEGVLPQRQADISFIPYYLRKAYHMQTPDERATVYAYNFFRLLSRTGNATLLYAAAETAEGGKGMSRFIMQMLYSDEFDVTRAMLVEASQTEQKADSEALISHRSFGSTMQQDEKGVFLKKDGKPYCLTPSVLNSYITCPRCFALSYIEGYWPEKEEGAEFGANTIGSFVHHMIEYIYKTYFQCDSKVAKPVNADEIEAIRTDEAKMEEALTAAYAKMNELANKNQYNASEHYGDNVLIKAFVSNILERDREDAKTGLQIWLLEQKRTFPMTIKGVGQLRIGGTIDRLDIYGAPGQEVLRVVDYKSGNYGDKTHEKKMSAMMSEIMTNEDKGYVRQTLIYSHAVMRDNEKKRPIEPNLFYCRHKMTNQVTTIDVDGQTVRDYSVLQENFLKALQPKIKELLTATEFPQCEDGKCPNYCPFFEQCGRKPKEL